MSVADNIDLCNMGDCPNPKHGDSVRGFCKRHHLAYQRVLWDVYFSLPGERVARAGKQGHWYPACGGTETPFITRNRRRLLYCWQPSTGKHAYLDLDTDLILSDYEAQMALGF
jgi:hypothetical protein